MKIGILQTGHSPEGLIADFGDYGEMFTYLLDGHDFAFEIYSVVDGQFPPGIHDADGWLVTGSKHGAYEDHPWIPPLEDFLRAAYSAAVPIIGVCFGHQILAQALGGKVEKFSGGWAVGPTEYHMESGEELLLNAWHQDQVTEKPADAKVIATSPHCKYAMLAYGDRALTIQPHPEHSTGFFKGLIEKRGRGVVSNELLNAAESKLDAPVSSAWMADKMAEFFKQPRG